MGARCSRCQMRESSFRWLCIPIVSLPILTFSFPFAPPCSCVSRTTLIPPFYATLSRKLLFLVSLMLFKQVLVWLDPTAVSVFALSPSLCSFLFILFEFLHGTDPSEMRSLGKVLATALLHVSTSMEIRCFVIKAKRCMLTIAHLLVFRFLPNGTGKKRLTMFANFHSIDRRIKSKTTSAPRMNFKNKQYSIILQSFNRLLLIISSAVV